MDESFASGLRARGASLRVHAGVRSRPPIAERRAPILHLETAARNYGSLELALAAATSENALMAVRVLDELDARGWRVPDDAVKRGWRPCAGLDDSSGVDRSRRELSARRRAQSRRRRVTGAFLAREEKRPLVSRHDGQRPAGILRALAHRSRMVFTRASPPRSADPRALAALAAAVAPDVPGPWKNRARGTRAAWRSSPRIVVAGSIFLLET